MSTQDQVRWNERYAKQTYGQRHHPSELLRRWIERDSASLPSGSIAWDVACGTGRNLLYLVQSGYEAVGLDIADVGLAQARQRLQQAGSSARLIVHDLDLPTWPEELSSAPQLVVVFRYLNLALLPRLAARLAIGGTLIVEVHLQSEADVGGPGSARFRAAPGAVRQAVLGADLQPDMTSDLPSGLPPGLKEGALVVEHDYEGLITDPDGSPMALAQLVVRREG